MGASSEETSQISIVIPAYNAEAYLAETLESVSNQTERTWQCVIVDDGSTDGTAAVATRFVEADRRFRLVQQANQGVASARNHGLEASDGEFVLFLDADDLLESDAIECLREVLVSNPDSPAVHGRAAVIDHRGAPSDFRGYEQTHGRVMIGTRRFLFSAVPRIERPPDTSRTGIDVLVLRNPITTPGQVLVRRRALDITGGFDLAAPPAEDWDMWIRLARLGSLPICRRWSSTIEATTAARPRSSRGCGRPSCTSATRPSDRRTSWCKADPVAIDRRRTPGGSPGRDCVTSSSRVPGSDSLWR